MSIKNNIFCSSFGFDNNIKKYNIRNSYFNIKTTLHYFKRMLFKAEYSDLCVFRKKILEYNRIGLDA